MLSEIGLIIFMTLVGLGILCVGIGFLLDSVTNCKVKIDQKNSNHEMIISGPGPLYTPKTQVQVPIVELGKETKVWETNGNPNL